MSRIAKLQNNAEAARRTAIERPARTIEDSAGTPAHAFAPSRAVDQVAEAAHGLDDVDAELLAQAADEDLDGVRVAVEILVVEVLGQLAARDDAARYGASGRTAAGTRARSA